MHEFLTNMEKHTTPLPIYIENALSDQDDADIRALLDSQIAEHGLVELDDNYRSESRFHPRVMRDLSRLVIEFEMPKHIEEKIDSIVKPLYSEEIRMSHYSYLGYDPKYSDNQIAPSLPPHIDAADTIITFNYQIGGNTPWDLFVDGERVPLKTKDVAIFSAKNQVHWRPKKIWTPGEFVEIVTINYSPLDNWRFTGDHDPLDPNMYPEDRERYQEELHNNLRMQKAWNLYNQMGTAEGIPEDVFGAVVNE